MKAMQTKIPEELYKKATAMVEDGWFRDEQDVFVEALRRFLGSHRPELMQKFIHDDIDWGLKGND